MAHITLPEGMPGIRGPMRFRPETAAPLNELVEVLLRGPSTLSQGERELIATLVSARNDCHYCHSIHGAIAAHHLGGDEALVESVRLEISTLGRLLRRPSRTHGCPLLAPTGISRSL